MQQLQLQYDDFKYREPADVAAAGVVRYGRFITNMKNPRASLPHPSDDDQHGLRVEILSTHSARLAEQHDFDVGDVERMQAIARAHDHEEIYPPLGDVQACYKMLMTPRQREELERLQALARSYVKREFPRRYRGFEYPEIIDEAHEKATVPAQMPKQHDVADGYCESIHNAMAGSRRVVQIQYWEGHRLDTPMVDYELRVFGPVRQKLALLEPLYRKRVSPFFIQPQYRGNAFWQRIARHGRPHTLARIDQLILANEIPMYSAWLRVLRDSRIPEVLDWLITSPGPIP